MYRTPPAGPTLPVILLLLLFAGPASAQSEGRVSVGGSVTFVSPTDEDVENTISIGPLVRLNPRRGWGLAAALNWFRADLRNPAGGAADFARLRVRPLMAGIGYTVGDGRTLVNVSVVAGPSFNSARFTGNFGSGGPGVPVIDAKNSFAIRPGLSMTHTVAPRVGITAFAGYMINRPGITYQDSTRQPFQDRWNADSLVLSAGVVYSFF